MNNSLYTNCCLCPRRCGVNRDAGQLGFCGETSELRVAFAGIHRGEEPPISGEGGSGTVFISGCNLGCAFCQNYQISRQNARNSARQNARNSAAERALGRVVGTEELASICLSLRENGAENINIVTGSHAAPAIAAGINKARKRGLDIPVLWNSSGYEGDETLEILKDFVDMYLPDLKTLDSSLAARFNNAPDYPEHAAKAILKMMESRQTMVRHLVLPGFLENTRQVLRWFAENCINSSHGSARLSLMTQYTPVYSNRTNTGIPAGEIPAGFVSEDEYKLVLSMLDEFGIDDGFCQELVTGSEWLPDFSRPNPFSSELSNPVWHWSCLPPPSAS